ncbi:MAG: NAD(P)-dependent glycerol-3-phosphate dehydrogenase [Bacteroidia bacterium]|nr:NAD(P)-dependent glycerol-3-phosphate dehydrogenase [Bacteroidia bacterium]
MRIGIAGTGTWATALAQVLVDNGHSVILYGREESQVSDINQNHQNIHYFGPDIHLDPRIIATTEIIDITNNVDAILLSVPTSAIAEIVKKIEPLLKKKTLIINTAKGFDPETHLRMSEVIRLHLPKKKLQTVVSLLGPSHAEEVIVRHLTLITSVSRSKRSATLVQQMFSNDYFRVYVLKDEIGAEYATAMKNCIAIAAGIIDGLGLGDNAKAALITRGLNEMVRFGRHFHARFKTYLGLSGVGDLVVTCGSRHSRNYQAGFMIGQDNSSKRFLKENTKTVEGVRTAKVIHEIAQQANMSLPIVEAIYRVLYESATPLQTISDLMNRPLKEED